MSLIHDLDELRRFYEVLVEMDYYGTIYVKSRNKYVTSDGERHHGKRSILEHIIVDTNRMSFEKLVNRISRVSAVMDAGLYQTKQGTVVTPDSVVFYLNFNSLDPESAWRELQIKFLKTGFDRGVVDVYMSELHKSARFKVHRLDVDTKDIASIEGLLRLVQPESVLMSVETKNGFHVILKNRTVSQELYTYVDQHPEMSMTKNGMMALPGCYQAGYPVRMVNLEGWVEARKMDWEKDQLARRSNGQSDTR